MVAVKDMKKIGILGGTFDPVHLGHINLALDAKREVGLDKVLFIPAKLQPFKLDRKTASGTDRLAMLEEALCDIDGLETSSYELDADGISYTYITMRAMKERFGSNAHLYFIMGTDSFLKLETWKNSEELLHGYSYIVGTRPGYRIEELENCIERIRRDYNTEVKKIHNIQFDISSTEIRRRIDCGISCGDLITDRVERYIRANGLYKE